MLISLLVAYLIFGGSGTTPFLDLVKQFEAAAVSVVADPQRLVAVNAVLGDFQTAIQDQAAGQSQSVKALAKVGEDHSATAADLLAIFDAQERANLAFQDRLIALHGDLKSRVTPAEWAAIFAKAGPNPSRP
jgi:cephalosporin-C deacetylase-like acetyl esterase